MIIQFLYGSCSRRRREQKEKVAEKESKSGGDDSAEDEEDEFELIQEDSNPEETPQDTGARGSQEDPKEDPKERRCESREEGRTLFVTKYGEVYHLQEDCEKTKGYTKYQRFPCKECKEQSKEVLRIAGSSGSNREGTALYVTPKDQCYHHPTCPKMLKWKYKIKRVRCLICEGKESRNQKGTNNEGKAER